MLIYDYPLSSPVNIYVAHSRSFDFVKELYEPIRESVLSRTHTIVLPHEASDEPFDSKTYLRDEADVLIAEVSEPSIGLGMELAWADQYRVPIICVYRSGANVSSSVRTVSNRFLEYASGPELIRGLETILEHEDRFSKRS